MNNGLTAIATILAILAMLLGFVKYQDERYIDNVEIENIRYQILNEQKNIKGLRGEKGDAGPTVPVGEIVDALLADPKFLAEFIENISSANVDEIVSRLKNDSNFTSLLVQSPPLTVSQVEEISEKYYARRMNEFPKSGLGNTIDQDKIVADVIKRINEMDVDSQEIAVSSVSIKDKIVEKNTCLDYTVNSPLTGITFESGAQLCNGSRPIITLKNYSRDRIWVHPIGGKSHHMKEGASIELESDGTTKIHFYLSEVDDEKEISVGGVSKQ